MRKHSTTLSVCLAIIIVISAGGSSAATLDKIRFPYSPIAWNSLLWFIAKDVKLFEKHGLDVTIARPYATGVDALNALQAGETDMVQAGVPSIGAILRGMDLVFFGNYSGNATKFGSDATLALTAVGSLTSLVADIAARKSSGGRRRSEANG